MSKNHKFRVACIQMTTGIEISENLSILETRFQEAKGGERLYCNTGTIPSNGRK